MEQKDVALHVKVERFGLTHIEVERQLDGKMYIVVYNVRE